MFRNEYIKELYKDESFINRLNTIPQCYRIFLPFLMDNNYLTEEDLALEQMYEEGILDKDIHKLCEKASIPTPYWYPCRQSPKQSAANIFMELFGIDFGIGSDDEIADEDEFEVPDLVGSEYTHIIPLRRYCIGIGHFKTRKEGQIHLCILLDLYDYSVVAMSFCKDYWVNMTELVIRHGKKAAEPFDCLIHSSRHVIYRTARYLDVCTRYHIERSMVELNKKAKVVPVSRFFTDLKQATRNIVFEDIQDGIDWLSIYILKYNLDIATGEIDPAREDTGTGNIFGGYTPFKRYDTYINE